MTLRDLSHGIESGMPVYPGDPACEVTPVATFDRDGYRTSELRFGSHTGTHVDVPAHTEKDGATVDTVPLSAFRFDAHCVDLRGLDAREPITVTDLGNPSEGDLLVLQTGWDEHWGTERYRDHPYVTATAATWCAEHNFSVAIDAGSVDPTPSPNMAEDEPMGFPAHHALLGQRRLIVENLTGLAGLPRRFRLDAFPLPVQGGDGAPVRAIATVD